MAFSHIITASGTITATVGPVGAKRIVTIPPDHRFYAEIIQTIKDKNEDKFLELADLAYGIREFIHRSSDGEEILTVKDGVVCYKGMQINNVICDRIVDFMSRSLPHEHMCYFLENLLLNPSYHSVKMLFNFLDHHGLSITEDGHFLAFKRVQDNWTDFNSGTIKNEVGCRPFMLRNLVDDNWAKECSSGFHVGTKEYVLGFHRGTGHCLICKVHPKDVVAVPEADFTKMRVCGYEVLEEINLEETNLDQPLYTSQGGSYVPPENSDEAEEEWKDDDEDDDYDYDDDEVDEEDEMDNEDEEVTDEETVLFLTEYFRNENIGEEFLDDARVLKAISQKDTNSFVQYVYALAMVAGHASSMNALENPDIKAALQRIIDPK